MFVRTCVCTCVCGGVAITKETYCGQACDLLLQCDQLVSVVLLALACVHLTHKLRDTQRRLRQSRQINMGRA